MPNRKLTQTQLQWAIEQQQLIVEAADAKLRWAERMLAQASTERAATEAHTRADDALLEVEFAEEHLRGLQHQMATGAAASPRRAPRRASRAIPGQGSLFDAG